MRRLIGLYENDVDLLEFQHRVRLTWAMVLCRLYEQVHHSFVETEQEPGLKDLRQPTEICHLDRVGRILL